jgi:hypothetical protein
MSPELVERRVLDFDKLRLRQAQPASAREAVTSEASTRDFDELRLRQAQASTSSGFDKLSRHLLARL